jgi:hypothetical protein
MSGLTNTLFGGGGSSKTDRTNTLQGFTNSKNLFNFALPSAEAGAKTGAATTAAGTNAMGSSLDYFKTLMSGNRAATQQAIAPVANQQASAADASRKQLDASGTARGGGVASTNADAKTKQMASIDNLLFGAQTEGAKGTADTSKALAATGTAESSTAAQLLGVGENANANLTANSIDARKNDQAQNADTLANTSDALLGVFSLFA